MKFPPIVFGTRALANVERVLPEQTRSGICAQWFQHVSAPVFVDVSSEYGDGAALEFLWRTLDRLDVAPSELVLCDRLSWDATISAPAMRKRLSSDCQRLRDQYHPGLVAIDRVDEYVSGAPDRARRLDEVLDGYRALDEIRSAGKIHGLGVVSRDWRMVEELVEAAGLDWVMLVGGLNILQHDDDVLSFLQRMEARHVPVICRGALGCGFLLGGSRLDMRNIDPHDAADRSLLAWRKSFVALCQGHGVSALQACVQFCLAMPGVAAVALEASHPDRIAEQVDAASAPIADSFWISLNEENLLDLELRGP